MTKITFRAEILQEGDLYVGPCPELNVSSFGETVEEARRSLHEAMEAFIEECEAMGTLEDVMSEAGFVKERDKWVRRKPVAEEALSIG
jgi:predicted RNase H-like HicB family nuclease